MTLFARKFAYVGEKQYLCGMKRFLALWLVGCVCCAVAQAQLRVDNPDSVLRAMTLHEKATLVVGNGWGSMFKAYHLPFCGEHKVPGAAGETRAIPRLGIPSIVFSDGPAGVRVRERGATAFPVGISLASVQDTALIEAVGRAMGEEAASYGIDVLLMPGMGLMRNPLCGRNYEYFSEDPALSGRVASAMIRGVQQASVGTSAKHYALNNQETNRFHNDVRVDSVTMHNLYLENFRIAIQGASPWTVMSSYNQVNGTPVQRHPYLLTDVLRRQWGYEGVCLTDWTLHRHAAAKVQAGTDLLMPGWKSRIGAIERAVRRAERGRDYHVLDTLSEARLTEAAGRVLRLIAKTNTFRGDSLYGQPYDTLAHRALARRAAAAGCVLLRNEESTLPLTNPPYETAEAPSLPPRIALFGVHSYSLLAGGTGSGYVNCAYRVSLCDGLHAAGIVTDSVLEKDYRRFMKLPTSKIRIGGMSIVSKYMGQPAYHELPLRCEPIEAACRRTEVAVVTIGRQAGEGGDRSVGRGDWLLTEKERNLLADVCRIYHAAGKRVIVVLNIAGPIETASWRDLPDAILLAWCPGQEGGHAIADILLGKVRPTGKLPISFPIHYEDLPSSRNFPAGTNIRRSVRKTRYEEKDEVGHRFYDAHPSVAPAYPFGFGLTY